LLVGVTVLSTACAHQWLRAESAHVVIYSDVGEADIRDVASRLEGFEAFLHWATHQDSHREGEPPRRLDFFLAATLREFQRTWPGGEYVDGYLVGPLDRFAMALRSREFQSVWSMTEEIPFLYRLLHSYAQHFRFCARPLPTWLAEGWAEYYGEMVIEAERPGRPEHLQWRWALQGRYRVLHRRSWLPIPKLLGRTGPTDGSDPGIVYAQSWLLFRYLRSDLERRNQLEGYMRAVCSGADPAAAMEVATGLAPERLQAAMGDYFSHDLSNAMAWPGFNEIGKHDQEALEIYVAHRVPPIRAAKLTVLPESADDFLLEVQRIKVGVAKPDQPAFLETIRRRAARWRGDRLADLALARAEVSFGDRAAGAALLDRALASNPNDIEALELRALGLMLAGDDEPARRASLYAEARGFLARAYKLEPNRYQTLFLYAMSQSVDPDYPTENTLNVLLRAHELAPEVGRITLMAADALIRAHHVADAAELLVPLAQDPRGGEASSRARAVLDKLRSSSRTGP